MAQLIGLVILLWHGMVFSAVQNPPNITTTTLDNGLKIIVKVDNRAPVFISQLWYKVGASDESKSITGISHMLEHMMFRGTVAYPAGEFSRIIAKNGGDDNAFTSRDYTAYYQKMHKSKLALAIKMEADRMRNLTFSDTELSKERQVVIEERRMRVEDNPNAKVYEHLNLISFAKEGAYHAPIIGFQTDLESYQLRDLRQWYQHFYVPNNATLVVAGDVDAKQVVALAEQYFSHYKSQIIHRKDKPSIALKGNKKVLKLKAQLPFYAMSFHVPSLSSNQNDAYSLEMLAYVLDNSLLKSLVRESQVVSSIGIGYRLYDKFDTTFTLSFTPAKGVNINQVLREIKVQVSKLINQPYLFEAQLAHIKVQLEADFIYQQDQISTQAYYLGMLETNGLGIDKVFEYVDKMNAITTKEMANVAKKYLNFKQMNTVELVPQGVQ